MKTTLTQAWEARGLGGMLLRETVRRKLINRLYVDSKREAAEWFLIEFMLLITSVVVEAFLFKYGMPVLPLVNLSVTFEFGMAAFIVGMMIALGVNSVALVSRMAKEYRYIGSTERYIFQHRDDEVEL